MKLLFIRNKNMLIAIAWELLFALIIALSWIVTTASIHLIPQNLISLSKQPLSHNDVPPTREYIVMGNRMYSFLCVNINKPPNQPEEIFVYDTAIGTRTIAPPFISPKPLLLLNVVGPKIIAHSTFINFSFSRNDKPPPPTPWFESLDTSLPSSQWIPIPDPVFPPPYHSDHFLQTFSPSSSTASTTTLYMCIKKFAFCFDTSGRSGTGWQYSHHSFPFMEAKYLQSDDLFFGFPSDQSKIGCYKLQDGENFFFQEMSLYPMDFGPGPDRFSICTLSMPALLCTSRDTVSVFLCHQPNPDTQRIVVQSYKLFPEEKEEKKKSKLLWQKFIHFNGCLHEWLFL